MRLVIAVIALVGLAGAGDRPGADWEAGYQARLRHLIGTRNWPVGNGTSDADAGKRDWPALLAELWKVRHDPTQRDRLIHEDGARLLASRCAGSFYKPFTAPGYTLYYREYAPFLPPEQRSLILETAAKSWEFLTRSDHHIDPIYNETEFNSEKFNWMARMAGVCWAHTLGDRERIPYFDDYLRNLVRSLYSAGRVEWNSNIYWGYTFQAALVLHECTDDPAIRRQAQDILDWMVFEAALHYFDGFQVGPDVRAKEVSYKPFVGPVWPYTYLYFVDGDHHPSYSDEDAAAHMHVQETGYVPYCSYRPPNAAIAIAQRRFRTPVEIFSAKPWYGLDANNYTGEQRRFEFETLFLERDYTLGSVATYRPDGAYNDHGMRPFSEESVWGLGVRGNGSGAIQVFGNAGDFDTSAGRCPYEEVVQYANVLLRVVRGADRIWVAIPKTARTLVHGSRLFVDLNGDVFVAFSAEANSPVERKPWRDASYWQFVWSYPKGRLGALAMEVGRRATDGSFEAFQQTVSKNSRLTSIAADSVEYRSVQRRRLRVKFQPLTTYTMHDGTVVSPAGTIPAVWRDGKRSTLKVHTFR